MTAPASEYRQALYEQLSRLTRAMAHPARLQVLDLLLQAPRTVEVLAGEIGISVAATSQHLQVLRTARLVESEKKGLYVTYRLADQMIYDVMRNLREVAAHRLAEVEQLIRQSREGRDFPAETGQDALLARLKRGEVVLVDVRPAEEFAAGHLPGAVGIPLAQLDARLDELPRDREVIAYCRGTYCLLAVQAVEILRRHGYKATYLPDGVRELELSGVELEKQA